MHLLFKSMTFEGTPLWSYANGEIKMALFTQIDYCWISDVCLYVINSQETVVEDIIWASFVSFSAHIEEWDGWFPRQKPSAQQTLDLQLPSTLVVWLIAGVLRNVAQLLEGCRFLTLPSPLKSLKLQGRSTLLRTKGTAGGMRRRRAKCHVKW